MTDRARAASRCVEGIDSLSGVAEGVEAIKDALGVAHVAYHATAMAGVAEADPFIRTTYSAAWVDRYVDQKYQNLDPVVLASLNSVAPVDWRALDFQTRRRRDFMDEAKAFDISPFGVTIPLRGPGGEHALFSLNASSGEKDWSLYLEETKSDLMTIANLLHERIRLLTGAAPAEEPPTLSRREADVLFWLARGKTIEEVGDILRISPRTVRAHSDSARSKLGAVNTVNAVAKALSAGLIAPLIG